MYGPLLLLPVVTALRDFDNLPHTTNAHAQLRRRSNIMREGTRILDTHHPATRCNTLQHAATHCNSLQQKKIKKA